MFAHTDTEQSPWYVVEADDKRRARLNMIQHLLQQVPHDDILPPIRELPPRQPADGYVRPPLETQRFVADPY